MKNGNAGKTRSSLVRKPPAKYGMVNNSGLNYDVEW